MINLLPSYPDCYICGSSNKKGFQQKIFYDDETKSVYTDFNPDKEHTGYKDIVHGGIFLALLDEIMAWVCICESQNPCLTMKLDTRFLKKAKCNVEYRISGRVDKIKGKMIFASSKITDSDDITYYESKGVYIREDDDEFLDSLHGGKLPNSL